MPHSEGVITVSIMGMMHSIEPVAVLEATGPGPLGLDAAFSPARFIVPNTVGRGTTVRTWGNRTGAIAQN